METSPKLAVKKPFVTIYGVAVLLIVIALIWCAFLPGSGQLTVAKRTGTTNRIEQVQTAVLAYYTEYSIFPVTSDNATLIRILDGSSADGNTRRIPFLSLKPSEMDSKGELVDLWDTPIQFSVSVDGKLHARSAGPDKIFGTTDDIGGDTNLFETK